MIAQELEVSLHMAFVEARQARHEFITVEHLLLALLDNPSAAEVLRACAVNIEDLRKTLTNFIGDNTPTVPGTGEVDTQPTLGFQRVIQRAIMHVQSASNGKKEVTGANVLVAIFGEKDSHAVYYLHQQGVTRLDVVNFISHGVRKDQQMDSQKASEGVEEAQVEGQTKESPLDQFTQNLNKAASEGKIDPLIGREDEVDRVIQILCRRRKNNPLLVAKERTPGKDEKPEDKEKLDKEFKEKLAKHEEKLKSEKRFEQWVYIVPKYTVEPLLKGRAELLKEEPKAEEKKEESTTSSSTETKPTPPSPADSLVPKIGPATTTK